jgi:hypothetical protein
MATALGMPAPAPSTFLSSKTLSYESNQPYQKKYGTPLNPSLLNIQFISFIVPFVGHLVNNNKCTFNPVLELID